MMCHKALLFGDSEIAKLILNTENPKKHKELGRKVRNFDEHTWKLRREQIVYKGNYLKFTQNLHLKNALIETVGTTLVEASPYDRIWGIGLSASDPRAKNRETWRGQNLLGDILTRVRNDIIKEEAIQYHA